MAFSTTKHVEYCLYETQWQLNKDAARDLVKQKKEKYLPINTLPDAALTKPENVQINEFIKHKYNTQIWPMSVFYGITRPTIGAWIGLIMAKKPTVQFTDAEETETDLDYLMRNADGAGNGICTVAKLGLEACIETGGGGFLVSVPDGQMTAQSLRDGTLAPLIKLYDRSNIMDWNTVYVNGQKQCNYLKLREWEAYSDGNESQLIEKHIEFFLRDGSVYYEISRSEGFDDLPAFETGDLIEAGKVATEIPFYWFGANDNDDGIDAAPITPIAALNVLHYQLYSRHIQQCWDVGQAQYHIDHGTQTSATVMDENNKQVSIVDYLNPGGIKTGSLAAIHTINGGKVEILQASTDSLLADEPTKIEERAQKIGAQMLVESSTTTATEANLSYGSSTANLVTIADNVGMGLKEAIVHIAEVIRYKQIDQIKFELNKHLITQSLDANEINAMWTGIMQGMFPLKAAFIQLQKSGKVPQEWTYETFTQEISESQGELTLAGVVGRQ